MHLHFDELVTRHFSPRLWRSFGSPMSMNPSGSSYQTPSGNSAFGFFDDFHTFNATSLDGPYMNLLAAGCTAALAADTAQAKGVLALTIDGNLSGDEAVLKWGGLASAPFFLADNDLAFECRLSVNSIVASRWAIVLGLGEANTIVTDGLMVDTTGVLADRNFVGFNKLLASPGTFEAGYRADGQTYQGAATNTRLANVLTPAINTYFKLGFRYHSHPKTLEWYVNGVIPGGNVAPARLTAAQLDAATFPDDVFLAPIIGIKDLAGAGGVTVNIDWWACAQYE